MANQTWVFRLPAILPHRIHSSHQIFTPRPGIRSPKVEKLVSSTEGLERLTLTSYAK